MMERAKYMVSIILLMSTGCATQHQSATQRQYVVERVKDVNGNDAFLRIDLTEGEECVIGHGFAVVRLIPGMPPENGYLVPFCHEQRTSK
jgi:hypothetical protein